MNKTKVKTIDINSSNPQDISKLKNFKRIGFREMGWKKR